MSAEHTKSRSWLSPAFISAFTVLGSIPIKLLRDPLNDPDLWWHLKTGALIARSGVPKVDPFSIGFQGKPWVVQEWGAELLFHHLRSWFGLGGILAYRSLLLFLVYLVVAKILVRRMGSGIGTWALLALTAYAGSSNWTERPNLISFLFLAIIIDLLDKKSRSLWLVVPLMVAWANIHGMVLLGLGMLVVVVAAEWLKVNLTLAGADAAWAKRVSLVTLIGAVGTLANPVGIGLHVHALRLVGTVSSVVTEWASPNFHEASTMIFAALLFITIAAMILTPRTPDLTEIALAFAFIFLGLQAVRNLAVTAIVLGVVAAGTLPDALKSVFHSRAPRSDNGAVSVPLGVMGWIFALGGFVVLLVTGLPQDTRTQTLATNYPVAAIDALKVPGTNVFSYDVWSGMIIDRAWPEAHVFDDLRTDFYGIEHIRRYQDLMLVLPGWERILDDACVTDVLIKPVSGFAEMLSRSEAWRETQRTKLSVTFHRVVPIACEGSYSPSRV